MARAMKNSGNKRIGCIPAMWEVKKLKYVAQLYTGNSIKDEEKERYEDPVDAVPYLSSKDIDVTFLTADYENGMYVKKEDASFKFAPAESTLMCIEGGSAGRKKTKLKQRVAFVNKLCCFNPTNIDSSFLYYWLCSPNYEDEFKQNITGLIGGVSVSVLQGFGIAIPPLEEQVRISTFLDAECARIDAVMEQTRASIEEYKKLKQSIITEAVTKGIEKNRKMKPCHTEWIDEIPIDWDECRIKNVIFPQQKTVYEDDEIITCFRDGIVTLRKNRREDGFTVSFTENGYQGVDEGDLVIHGMDAFAGAIGCSDSRGKTTPVVHVCKTIGNNRFFMYFLRSMAYGNILMDLSNGVRIRSSDFRNFSKLGVFGIVVPPVEEQNQIVAFLDEKVARLDKIVSEKEHLLAELEDYKKALVYEYVTGKKEVI